MDFKKHSIICIIPARRGSKAIPGKNIIDVSGKPLIAWTIEQAINIEMIDDVYVSTNDKEIADISKQYGAKIIWRPENISDDTASSEQAIIHALDTLKAQNGSDPELVVFLQATSPLRKKDDIKNAIQQIINEQADSLISGSRFTDFLFWEKKHEIWESVNFDYKNRGIRQERNPQFVENGSIYLFKTEIIRKYNNRIGGKLSLYEMEFRQTWEIDILEDIELIEFYLNKKINRVERRINNIDLFVYDFDGVMTDNKALVDLFGNESVFINRSDGLAIAEIKKTGILQIILSTEKNVVVQKRAGKLNIPCFRGINNKKEALLKYINEHNIDIEKVAYIGNDINDLEIMKLVELPIAPADACSEIKEISKIITKTKGGCGVIREIYNMIEK